MRASPCFNINLLSSWYYTIPWPIDITLLLSYLLGFGYNKFTGIVSLLGSNVLITNYILNVLNASNGSHDEQSSLCHQNYTILDTTQIMMIKWTEMHQIRQKPTVLMCFNGHFWSRLLLVQCLCEILRGSSPWSTQSSKIKRVAYNILPWYIKLTYLQAISIQGFWQMHVWSGARVE